MDSIARTKKYSWNNSMKVYFKDSGDDLLMFNFKDNRLNVFLAVTEKDGLEYYKNSLTKRGFKLTHTEKKENGYTEYYPNNSGGTWMLHIDETVKRFGVQLSSPEFTNDFMNFKDNNRISNK